MQTFRYQIERSFYHLRLEIDYIVVESVFNFSLSINAWTTAFCLSQQEWNTCLLVPKKKYRSWGKSNGTYLAEDGARQWSESLLEFSWWFWQLKLRHWPLAPRFRTESGAWASRRRSKEPGQPTASGLQRMKSGRLLTRKARGSGGTHSALLSSSADFPSVGSRGVSWRSSSDCRAASCSSRPPSTSGWSASACLGSVMAKALPLQCLQEKSFLRSVNRPRN